MGRVRGVGAKRGREWPRVRECGKAADGRWVGGLTCGTVRSERRRSLLYRCLPARSARLYRYDQVGKSSRTWWNAIQTDRDVDGTTCSPPVLRALTGRKSCSKRKWRRKRQKAHDEYHATITEPKPFVPRKPRKRDTSGVTR